MATIHCDELDGIRVLKLDGSLTSDAVEEIRDIFQTATEGSHPVMVDLSGVDMVTTPALSLFVAAHHRSEKGHGKVVFTQSAPRVKDVLQRLRLTALLQTANDATEAQRLLVDG